MELHEIEKVVRGQLSDNFSTAPIAWPNRHFKPSSDAPDGQWVRPTVRMSETQLKELGTDGVGERYGILFLDVFVKKNSGVKVGGVLVAELEALFRRKDIDGVIFDESTSTDLGIDTKQTDYNHHQIKVPIMAFIGE